MTYENTKRQLNFELLRIVSMMLIITLHFISHGEAVQLSGKYSAMNIIMLFIDLCAMVSVNCYVLLSSYFLKGTISLKKIWLLWMEVEFYSIAIYLFLCLLGKSAFSWGELMIVLLPIFNKRYWFFTCYIIFYVLTPLLNKIVTAIDRRAHLGLILGGLAILSILPDIWKFLDIMSVGYGYTFLWFCYLYFVASYIRCYEVPKRKGGLFSFFVLAVIGSACYLSRAYLEKVFYRTETISFSLGYKSFFVVACSILLFLYFANLKIENMKGERILLSLASATFGVYLIHDNYYMRAILWGVLHPYTYQNSWVLIPYWLFCVGLIFMVCSLIELLRQYIFRIIGIPKACEWIAGSLQKKWVLSCERIIKNQR